MPGLSDSLSLMAIPAELGQGWTDYYAPKDPAAGVTDVLYTADGSVWSMLVVARAVFTADATVGTRVPTLQLVDNVNTVWFSADLTSGVVASTSARCNVGTNGQTNLAASGTSDACWPRVLIPSGWGIRFHAAGTGAADAWSGVHMVIQKWATDITRTPLGG